MFTQIRHLFCCGGRHIMFICPQKNITQFICQVAASTFLSYFSYKLRLFSTGIWQVLTAFEQDHDGPARKLSTNLYDVYHCWMYSE